MQTHYSTNFIKKNYVGFVKILSKTQKKIANTILYKDISKHARYLASNVALSLKSEKQLTHVVEHS